MEIGCGGQDCPIGGNGECSAALCRLALALDSDLKELLALIAAQSEAQPRIEGLTRRAESKIDEAGALLAEIGMLLGSVKPQGRARQDQAPRPARHRVDSLAGRAVDHDFSIASVRARYGRLTTREKEVFRLITSHDIDISSKGIARRLQISPRTVECHRARVMKKMAARSLAELVTMAGLCGVSPALLGYGLAATARSLNGEGSGLRGAAAHWSAAAPTS